MKKERKKENSAPHYIPQPIVPLRGPRRNPKTGAAKTINLTEEYYKTFITIKDKVFLWLDPLLPRNWISLFGAGPPPFLMGFVFVNSGPRPRTNKSMNFVFLFCVVRKGPERL